MLLSGIEFISYFRLRYMIFFIVNPSYFVFKKKQFRQEIRHLVIDFENVPSGYFDPSENENRGRLLDTISSAFTSVAPSELSVLFLVALWTVKCARCKVVFPPNKV